MKPEVSIPDISEIVKADRARIRGQYRQASDATRFVHDLHLENFQEIDKLRPIVLASRVNVAANQALARGSREAPTVAQYLGLSKHIINKVYHDPFINGALSYIKEDLHGNPLDFGLQISLDEVRYLRTLAALTGNRHIYNQAVEKLNAIHSSSRGHQKIPILSWRKQELIYQNDQTRDNFTRLSAAYRSAIRNLRAHGRFGPMAQISSHHLIFSLGRLNPGQAAAAASDYAYAVRQDASVAPILSKEINAAIRRKNRKRQWRRTTPPGVDYSSLNLED